MRNYSSFNKSLTKYSDRMFGKNRNEVSIYKEHIDFDWERKKFENNRDGSQMSEGNSTHINDLEPRDFTFRSLGRLFGEGVLKELEDREKQTYKISRSRNHFMRLSLMNRNYSTSFHVLPELNFFISSKDIEIDSVNEVRIIFRDENSIFSDYKELPEEELKRLTKESIQFVNKLEESQIMWNLLNGRPTGRVIFHKGESVSTFWDDEEEKLYYEEKEKFLNHGIEFEGGSFKRHFEINKERFNSLWKIFFINLMLEALIHSYNLKGNQEYLNMHTFEMNDKKSKLWSYLLKIMKKRFKVVNQFIDEAIIPYHEQSEIKIERTQWIPGDGVNYPMFRIILRNSYKSSKAQEGSFSFLWWLSQRNNKRKV